MLRARTSSVALCPLHRFSARSRFILFAVWPASGKHPPNRQTSGSTVLVFFCFSGQLCRDACTTPSWSGGCSLEMAIPPAHAELLPVSSELRGSDNRSQLFNRQRLKVSRNRESAGIIETHMHKGYIVVLWRESSAASGHYCKDALRLRPLAAMEPSNIQVFTVKLNLEDSPYQRLVRGQSRRNLRACSHDRTSQPEISGE